ncbi:MAG: phosphatase PAP2 family protein [Aquabacterium sp.]|uniref:vanadium-dependent haloperoxidase n=1 Tax=Aquabacterium sp. TaxID=1872578 RepID=UPI001DC9476E|nr:vanadium-dependent haloperoxidase [Aquabacterium sp.]MBT9611072.1 phosphatase PAP2 family protein [Aquabacterium sp.]
MDHILAWNGIALEALRRDFAVVPGIERVSPEQGGPTLTSRALAIVHLAMYDAHAGVVNQPDLPRYLNTVASPAAGVSASAAVAAAAYNTLVALYPRQTEVLRETYLAATASGPGVTEGVAFGQAVAQALLADRANDPTVSDAGYAPSQAPGCHRPDPSDPQQGYHAPYYGARSKLFAVSARHELDAPPALGSDDYQAALHQVRGKGIAPELAGQLPSTYAKRTVDQSLVGVYWAYDGVRDMGTPPRLYNQIVREVAIARGNTVDDNARLFALVNAAMADAGILAWDQKYVHNLWRPVLGVREHDGSMGPLGNDATHDIDNDCDPNWLPWGAPRSNAIGPNVTPHFPAYPSGHATFGAAAFHVTRLFYGVPPKDRKADTVFTGSFVSEECNGVTRDNRGVVRARHVRAFPKGLWQMIEENGFSRVWLGVHWSFDAFALNDQGKPDLSHNVGGVALGLKIAEDIFAAGAGKAPAKSSVGPRA